MELELLGWAEPFKSAFETRTDRSWIAARVVSSQREHLRLWTTAGVVPAAIGGRLRHVAGDGELPVVGDWVAAALDPGAERAVVHAVLPRRGVLARKRPERSSEQQLMAANVDVVFVTSALNLDFSPRRIERALAVIWEGGAQPVVLLTKLDACDDPEPYLEEARAVALGVPVHAISVHTGEGLAVVREYLAPGRTAALIGSSGVGKSTFVNWCLGEARAPTSEARAEDDKGRHTTTARELFLLPEGGVLIDTPGLRELGLTDAQSGLETAFEDVEVWVSECRFADCEHRSEPGCAVRHAIESGALAPDRFAAYQKLQRELAYEKRRTDDRARHDHQRALRSLYRQRAKAVRAHPKR